MTWATIPLKRIATFTAGGTPAVDEPSYWTDEGDGYPWVVISDMSTVDTVTSTARRVSVDGLRAARIRLGKPGTILFSMYASLGHTAWLSAPAAWNQAILGLSADPTTDARFLRYCLISIRQQLQEQVRSNTQANLNAEVVGNLRLPRPPLGEQRRIADFLDAETARIDQLAALQKSVVETLNQRDQAVRDALFDELIDQFGELPLRRYSSKIEQGSSPSCENHPREGYGWGVLKLSAVKRGRFFPEENKQLPDEIEPVRKYEVREGDLLVTRANTPDLVGDVAVVANSAPRLLLPDLIYRVGLDKRLKAEFAAQAFLSTRVRGLIQGAARGSSQSMVKLRGEDIRDWPVPHASLARQSEVVSEIERQLESSERLRATLRYQLALLAERRQALITVAVTGAITV